MPVLHVIETLEFGGAEKVVVDLANRQVRDFPVGICCLKKLGELREQLDPRIAVTSLGKREGNDYRVPRRVADLARQSGAGVVHAHGWGTFLEGAAASFFAPRLAYVHTVHGAHLAYPPGLRSRVKVALRHLLERRLASRYRFIAAVSEVARQSAEREIGLPAERLVTVHNGIACSADAAPPAPGGGTPLVLITVGRLAAVKNQGLMLQALAELRRSGVAARLVVVGDGPERDALSRQAAELGVSSDVSFAGFRKDVGSLLASADMFLLSSRYEGVSIALLEAMRAGLPVVATSVGGVPETVADGETGLLTPNDDAPAFAAAVRQLALDAGLRRRLGAAGHTRLQQHFSLESTARRYRELYGLPLPAAPGERA
jgi:glycosyltransferase involved in cell wall biosynthesis